MTEIKSAALELGTERIRKLLVQYAVPAIIAMTASSLYNMVDSIFIGLGVGPMAISGLALTFPLMNLAAAFGSLVGVGAATLISMRLGQKDYASAQYILGNVVVLNFIIGLGFGLVTLLFLDPILYFFGASEATIGYARDYMSIILMGNVVTHMYLGLNSVLRSAGHPRKSMYATINTVVINTILDPLFIYGFGWGIRGAAIATVLAQIIALIWQFHILSDKSELLHFRRGIYRLRRKIVRDILAIGMSPFLNQMAMMVVQVVMNNTLTFYGASSVYGKDIPLACAGIISKVGMVFFSVIIGLSQGLQPIISFNYGAQQYGRVREAYLKTLRIAVAFSCIAFLCFQILPRQIIGLFSTGTESEEYFRFAEEYFRIYFFFTFINCIQPLTANFFTAIGKASRGIFISLTRQIIFLLPLLLLLPAMFGIDGVMFAGPVADMAAATMAALFMRAEFRRMKAVQPAA